jgi:hypothetical protein
MMEILRYRLDPIAEPQSPPPTLPLSRPLGSSPACQPMNASEQMYFFGAPLAHVVDYENHLRASRCEKTIREISRGRRALGFPLPLALPALPENTDAGGRL